MPRLIDYLGGYPPFERVIAQAAPSLAQAAPSLEIEVACPSHVHAYVAAGLLHRQPWSRSVAVVIAPSQEAALEMEHELGLYCAERPVVYLPPRGVWYGSEGEVKPRVAGRRARAVGALNPEMMSEQGMIDADMSPQPIATKTRYSCQSCVI